MQLFVKSLLKELPKENYDYLISLRNLFEPEIPLYQNIFPDPKLDSLPVFLAYFMNF